MTDADHPDADPSGIGGDLVRQGKVAWITTTGRRTGTTRATAVGYLDADDGSILVAAGDAATDWALNLLADPRCTVEIGDRRFPAIAQELSRADHGRAIAGLILRYGTPAERLGRGPSFRLVPIDH